MLFIIIIIMIIIIFLLYEQHTIQIFFNNNNIHVVDIPLYMNIRVKKKKNVYMQYASNVSTIIIM